MEVEAYGQLDCTLYLEPTGHCGDVPSPDLPCMARTEELPSHVEGTRMERNVPNNGTNTQGRERPFLKS